MLKNKTKNRVRGRALTAEIETKRGVYPGVDLQWKIVDAAQGIVRGYLSVFNNVDSQKDRVRPGAYKKTISEGLERKDKRGRKYLWPLLWMHDPEKPIGGFLDAVEDKFGLLVTTQLDISTNDQGIPRNPLATSVFSGFEQGYIDELSVGYKALQKSYDGAGVRDLLEMQVFEGSAVTMLFASNDQALVNDVKTASGGSFTLADRNTPWSKSKAIKDIEAATGGDWSKAAKYFFWSSADPKVEADLKFPFVASVGGEMKAVPRAIISAAGVLRGAMGGAKGIDDVSGIKAKIAGYYEKMGMPAPWSSASADKGKYDMPADLEKKDFADYYQQRQVDTWLSKFYDLTSALKCACMDAFGDGDQDSDIMADIDVALNGDGDDPGFIHALTDWANEGVALGYTNSGPSMGYMSRQDAIEGKSGAVVSKDNADRIGGHVATLLQVKDAIHSVAEDMQHYITGGPAFAPGVGVPTSGKTATYRPRQAPDDQTISRASTDGDFSAAMAEWLATEK